MVTREIGKSGLKATVVGLGTWAAGGDNAWGGKDDKTAVQAIKAGIDGGINIIDTAPSYGFGHSECLVGEARNSVKLEQSDIKKMSADIEALS